MSHIDVQKDFCTGLLTFVDTMLKDKPEEDQLKAIPVVSLEVSAQRQNNVVVTLAYQHKEDADKILTVCSQSPNSPPVVHCSQLGRVELHYEDLSLSFLCANATYALTIPLPKGQAYDTSLKAGFHRSLQNYGINVIDSHQAFTTLDGGYRILRDSVTVQCAGRPDPQNPIWEIQWADSKYGYLTTYDHSTRKKFSEQLAHNPLPSHPTMGAKFSVPLAERYQLDELAPTFVDTTDQHTTEHATTPPPTDTTSALQHQSDTQNDVQPTPSDMSESPHTENMDITHANQTVTTSPEETIYITDAAEPAEPHQPDDMELYSDPDSHTAVPPTDDTDTITEATEHTVDTGKTQATSVSGGSPAASDTAGPQVCNLHSDTTDEPYQLVTRSNTRKRNNAMKPYAHPSATSHTLQPPKLNPTTDTLKPNPSNILLDPPQAGNTLNTNSPPSTPRSNQTRTSKQDLGGTYMPGTSAIHLQQSKSKSPSPASCISNFM